MVSSPERDIIFIILNNKQTSLCPGVRNSLSSKTAPYTNIPEKVVWNKGRQCLTSEDIQEHKRPMENFLPKQILTTERQSHPTASLCPAEGRQPERGG